MTRASSPPKGRTATATIARACRHYSLQSEVFSLNALFAAALFLINSRLEATRDVSWAFVGSFLSGLGLTNQHTLALLVAPISVHAVARHPRDLLSPRGLGRWVKQRAATETAR